MNLVRDLQFTEKNNCKDIQRNRWSFFCVKNISRCAFLIKRDAWDLGKNGTKKWNAWISRTMHVPMTVWGSNMKETHL